MYRIFTKLENGGGQYSSSIADIVEFCKNRKRLQILSLLLPSCTVDGLNIIRDITESLVEIPKETSDTLHLEILRFCYELDNDNQKELQIIDMLLTKNPNDWLALCRKIVSQSVRRRDRHACAVVYTGIRRFFCQKSDR